MNKKYRLYVDETGNASYPRKAVSEVGKRYLALTGIAISEEEAVNSLSPRIDNLKYILTGDYDEHFSLHRDEIKDRRGIYSALLDAEIEAKWNNMIDDLVRNVDYTLFSVVIDKVKHMQKYQKPNHPYYYCMEVLIERYIKFLEMKNGHGDVMFESRGKTEDEELKRQYERIYIYGNRFLGATTIQSRLTSKKIKLKNKKQEIAGLEFADLLALATKLDTLRLYERVDHISSSFMSELIGAFQSKYYHNGAKGWGRKLLD